MMPWRYGTKDSGEPPQDDAQGKGADDEAEGHGVSTSPGKGLRISPDADAPSDEADDTDGHGAKWI